jgi:oligoendopeptidase F
VQNHLFKTKARKYNTCLEASLYPKNINSDVYHALITAVNESLPALHKYVSLREKIMACGPLHLYDMYVPLIAEVDIKLTYDEAAEAVVESVAPLGSEYQNLLRQGLIKDRWVDRYENKNKRSGAYSSGSYDSMPYILMNYKGVLRDVFTLAHEAGHSMHSLLSHKNQPYQYGHYPIFLAEVASTFNEELLMQYMLERSSNVKEKIYLINEKIEDIRGTLFRQTMFAEFELLIHSLAESQTPLTPSRLNEEYRKLNEKYFGTSVIIDEEAVVEWARIPHFYYNFYVYQYATGISAALALAKRVQSGGPQEQSDYLNFLKSGCSRYPIETLKLAGVDMSRPEPVKEAIKKFESLVDELGTLIAQEKDTLAVKDAKC